MTLLGRHSWEDTLGKTLLGRHSWEDTLGRHSWKDTLTLPFSSLVQKCQIFHGIGTFSPLDAALTMRLAENSRLHTSKVLRLPRKMKMEVSKVLRLSRKFATLSFCEPFKSIALVTQNDVRHVLQTQDNVTKSHACHAKHHFQIPRTGQKKVLQLFVLARGRHHTTIASRLDTSKAQNEHFV